MIRLTRFLTGLLLISIVPIAVVTPGIQGDVIGIAGLSLISPTFYMKLKPVLSKHKKLLVAISILWTVCLVTSFFLLRNLIK